MRGVAAPEENKLHKHIQTFFQDLFERFWGCAALAITLLCGALLYASEKQSYSLRTIPYEILCVLGAIGAVVFLLWGNVRLRQFTNARGNQPFLLCLVRNVLHLASVAGVLVFGFYFLIFMAFAHTPEHVVEKNGIKMVARVNSFLDVIVDYYQYKNPLFYGKPLGQEWYGSGGYDPFVHDEPLEPITWEFRDLEGNVIDYGPRADTSIYGEKAEMRLSDSEMQKVVFPVAAFSTCVKREEQSEILAFSSPPAAFINAYNSAFYAEKHMRYFPQLDAWYGYRYDKSYRNEPQLIRYYFTEDIYDAACPKISIYTAGADQAVQRIEICYDVSVDSQNMRNLQKDLFDYSAHVLFENISGEIRESVRLTLHNSAYESICSDFADAVPGNAVKTLCYQGSVGVYAYVMNKSEMHICFVPLTEELLREYESKGVTLYSIPEDFKK